MLLSSGNIHVRPVLAKEKRKRRSESEALRNSVTLSQRNQGGMAVCRVCLVKGVALCVAGGWAVMTKALRGKNRRGQGLTKPINNQSLQSLRAASFKQQRQEADGGCDGNDNDGLFPGELYRKRYINTLGRPSLLEGLVSTCHTSHPPSILRCARACG